MPADAHPPTDWTYVSGAFRARPSPSWVAPAALGRPCAGSSRSRAEGRKLSAHRWEMKRSRISSRVSRERLCAQPPSRLAQRLRPTPQGPRPTQDDLVVWVGGLTRVASDHG